jgi:oxygen-independent coproporphyrinogen-3 oxidase
VSLLRLLSVPAEGQDRGANLDALLREIDRFAPTHPTTVFVGGGTPSLLAIDELTRLFDGIERASAFRGSATEVTVECNPESLDREKARRLLDLGVTRFSIGFQSLSNDVLELFGRVHSVDDSFRAYEAVRAAGATNVNIDLIYAIPGQSAEQWERDLERVLALGPDHLSAYNLTFEEDTLFRRWLEEGRLSKSPEEVELALFDATRRQTSASGLHAYEISNFARSGHRCAHNENYWRNGTYLGVGPSAVSKSERRAPATRSRSRPTTARSASRATLGSGATSRRRARGSPRPGGSGCGSRRGSRPPTRARVPPSTTGTIRSSRSRSISPPKGCSSVAASASRSASAGCRSPTGSRDASSSADRSAARTVGRHRLVTIARSTEPVRRA